MCMTIKKDMKVPRKGRWVFKVLKRAGKLGLFRSCIRSFVWTAGELHIARGVWKPALLPWRVPYGETTAEADVNGGVFHSFTSLQRAIHDAQYNYGRNWAARRIAVVRLWVPEYAARCVGEYGGSRNLGAACLYLPKKCVYSKGKWIE